MNKLYDRIKFKKFMKICDKFEGDNIEQTLKCFSELEKLSLTMNQYEIFIGLRNKIKCEKLDINF